MKAAILLSLLVAVASATPTPFRKIDKTKDKHKGRTTSNEFREGSCGGAMLLYARGTSQMGNMGLSPGPRIATVLEDHFGHEIAAIQGLDYEARLEDNFLEKGTSEEAIDKMIQLVKDVIKKCQTSRILLAGYSQGAAVVHGACEKMPKKYFNQIHAVVTLGDTRNKAHGGRVPRVPKDQTLIICNQNDTICTEGSMDISDDHLNYEPRAEEAANFLIKQMERV